MAIFIILICCSSSDARNSEGWRVRDQEGGVDSLIREIPELLNNGHRVVLIHGGGYFINELMERMGGLKPKFVTSPQRRYE